MEEDSFEKLGGRSLLKAITKTFYDKVYAHPWLGKFFHDVSQEFIESQQVDFMQQTLGGPKMFCGRSPAHAHMHINITEKLFEVRESLLLESLEENDAPEELILRWQKIDKAFKRNILKNSLQDCEKRYNTDTILDFHPE